MRPRAARRSGGPRRGGRPGRSPPARLRPAHRLKPLFSEGAGRAIFVTTIPPPLGATLLAGGGKKLGGRVRFRRRRGNSKGRLRGPQPATWNRLNNRPPALA